MTLLIDNYDSFSYNLFQIAGTFDPDIVVIRNDEKTVAEIEALHPDPDYPLSRTWKAGKQRHPDRGYPDAGRPDSHTRHLSGPSGYLFRLQSSITYAKKLMHGKQSEVLFDADCPLFSGCPRKSARCPIPFPGS